MKLRIIKLMNIFLDIFLDGILEKFLIYQKKKGLKILKHPKLVTIILRDIDDEFLITIHHYLKWYKYGFTRLWDNLSIEIRNGRMSRKKAISIIKKDKSNLFPKKEINYFCKC